MRPRHQPFTAAPRGARASRSSNTGRSRVSFYGGRVAVAAVEIETERLVLRRWRAEDRAPLAAINADPEVMRWIGVRAACSGRGLSDELARPLRARVGTSAATACGPCPGATTRPAGCSASAG